MFGLLHFLEVTQPLAETGQNSAAEFVNSIISSVTSNISLTMVATIVGSIIAAGIVAVVGWKYARKAYRFVKNAITGRDGNPM